MRRQFFSAMPLRFAGAAAMGALSSLLFGAAASAHADAMAIYNDASGDSYIRSGEEGGIGNQIFWNSDMQTEAGEVIGTGSGHCTQLDADENFYCSFIITLTDRGTIAGQGVQLTEPLDSTFPITGGTGEFEGITGSMHSRPVEDRVRFIYEIEYQTPSRK